MSLANSAFALKPQAQPSVKFCDVVKQAGTTDYEALFKASLIP